MMQTCSSMRASAWQDQSQQELCGQHVRSRAQVQAYWRRQRLEGEFAKPLKGARIAEGTMAGDARKGLVVNGRDESCVPADISGRPSCRKGLATLRSGERPCNLSTVTLRCPATYFSVACATLSFRSP